MPWEPVDFDPFADVQEQEADQTTPVQTQTGESAGMLANAWSGIKSAVTGNDRTEYPDAPELLPSINKETPSEAFTAINRSAITPDPEAQYDILKKAIPGLERRDDKFGNIMLKMPGMKDFAYLNKPGMSARDLDEFGTQTLATAPILGWAGKTGSLAARGARGLVGLSGSSVAQDVAAGEMGSEQGIDSERAAISGAIGGGIPVAGAVARGIGGAVAGGVNRLRNQIQGVGDPRGVAERVVQDAFRRDARGGSLANPQRAAQASDRAAAQQNRQDLRVMDFGGEEVAREGRKAANFSPSAKDALMRVITPRYEGQSQRLSDMMTGRFNLGNSSEMARQQLRDQARNTRAPLYNQAFRQGAGGVDSPVLQRLQTSPIFQKAMGRAERTIRDQAATPGWQTTGMIARGTNDKYTLEYWDQVKRALDDYAGKAIRGGQNSQGAQISQMARVLRQELDSQVPLYRQARGTAQEFFNAEDALDAGRNFAKGDFNLQDAEQAFNRLNAQERNLFTEGFADEFVRKIRGSTDRSNLLNKIANSPQERDRLRIALGQQRYDQLEGFLRLENVMEKMRNAMGNSTTAQQASDMLKGYGLQAVGSGAGLYGLMAGDPVTAIMGALLAGGRVAQLRINENIAREVAELLASRDPQLFLQGMQQLGRAPFSDAIRALDNLLADLGPAVPLATQGTVNATSYQPQQGQ